MYENWKPASKFCGNFLVGTYTDISKVPNYLRNRCNNNVDYVSWGCDHLLGGPRYVTQTQTLTATAAASAAVCATTTISGTSTSGDGTTGTPNPPAAPDDGFYDDFGPNDVKWEAVQPDSGVEYSLEGSNANVHGGYAARNQFPSGSSGIFYESVLFPISVSYTYRASFTAFYEGSGPCTIQPIVSPSDSQRGEEDPVWLSNIQLTPNSQTYDYTWNNQVFSYATFYFFVSCSNSATVWFDEVTVKKQQ